MRSKMHRPHKSETPENQESGFGMDLFWKKKNGVGESILIASLLHLKRYGPKNLSTHKTQAGFLLSRDKSPKGLPV